MVRLVKTGAGNVEIDATGKKEGRGTYLCPAWDCWEKALKGRQLEQALKSKITAVNREHLVKHGKELLEELKLAQGQ